MPTKTAEAKPQYHYTSMLKINSGETNPAAIMFIDRNGTVSEDLCCSYIIFKPKNNGVQYDIAKLEGVDNSDRQIVYEYDDSREAYVEQ